MSQKNQTEKRLWKRVGQIACIMGLLAGVTVLNVAVQKDRESALLTESQVLATGHMNVAVVNEDMPVTDKDKSYQLGASYIKNLERNQDHRWHVVPRGVAESGLQSGKYQLMVIIPSDFSKKVLDLESPTAQQSLVTYKVNGSGNPQIEKEADALGRDMVADLNRQLVNMYMAGILNNLYTAQKNVQAVTGVESQNISAYKTKLYQSALSQKNNFPMLASLSSSAVSANQGLRKSLEGYQDSLLTLNDTQTTFSKSMEALMKRQSEDKLSQAAFSQSLMEMDGDLLSQENERILTDMETAQKELEAQILGKKEDDSVSPDGAIGLGSNYKNQVAQLRSAVEKERQALENQKKGLSEFVAKKLISYYGLSDGQSVTFKDLAQKDPALASLVSNALTNSKTQLETASQGLPTANPASLGDRFSDISFDAEGIEQVLGHGLTYDTNQEGQLRQLQKEKADAEIAFKDAKSKAQVEAEIQLKVTGTTSQETYEYYDKDGKKVADLSPNNPTKVPLPGSIHVNYTIPGKTATIPVPDNSSGSNNSNPSDSSNSTTNTSNNQVTPNSSNTNTQPSSSTSFGIADQAVGVDVTVNNVTITGMDEAIEKNYLQASQVLTQKEAEIRSRYIAAQVLLDSLYPKDATGTRKEMSSDLLNANLTPVMTDLLVYVVSANLEDYTQATGVNQTDDQGNSKDPLHNTSQSLSDMENQINSNLTKIQGSNQTILDQIQKEKALLENLRQKMKALTEANTKIGQAQGEAENQATGVSNDLSGLMDQTNSTKEASNANLQLVDSVNQTFETMNQELEHAKNQNDQLSTDADSLMKDFDQELQDSGDFVASFSRVFNQAYEKGVPNETLLAFLSNPVKGQSSAVQAKVNSYRPFTWILLLEMSTLFTAYIFATQPLVKRLKNRFQMDRVDKDRLLTSVLLGGIATGIGLTVGIVSAASLKVGTEVVPSWVLLMTLSSFFLTFGQYLLLGRTKTLGMGVSFFMILAFVYLSQALGSASRMTGISKALKLINPLSILESSLSGYFEGMTASPALFFLLIILVGLLVTASLFMKGKEED